MTDRNYRMSQHDGHDEIASDLPERLWVQDDFTSAEDYPSANVTGGLVSLRFIKEALGRRRRLWCVTVAIGFLASCAFYFMSPLAYQASMKLLLTQGPYENIDTAANNDQAMAMTQAVAGAAVKKLGLNESAASFLGSYSAVPVTERVMTITVSAPSSQQAVARANAVGAAFLQLRAGEMQAQQKQELASLNQQVAQAQQQLDSINSQLSSSTMTSNQLKSLQRRRSQAASTLYNLQQAAISNQTTIEPATAAAAEGSVVLDAATPLPHSKLKPLVLDVGIGLIAGLVIGMAIVVIQALVSDKLRRRDDIAQALEAPVRLSVQTAARGRHNSALRGKSARQDVERIAGYLGRAVPGSSQGAVSLAVVPVDDLQLPAESLVSLAMNFARGGRNVVLADLSPGAPAAKLLGATGPGVGAVNPEGLHLVAAVPEAGDVAPTGPFDRGPSLGPTSPFTQEVATACARADVLLTLAALDPSVGGEHLATWSSEAVVTVTAGRSSWTKIHGVAEMVRLSGTQLNSAVVAGADKTDESLGTTYLPEMV